MCAKDARPRDCSVPENPGVNSSTLGMPGLDCSVQWILGCTTLLRMQSLWTAVCQRILVSAVVH